MTSNQLTPSPADSEGFITPEVCQRLWGFNREEIEKFTGAIVQHRGKSKLKADGTFRFDYAVEVAEKIIAKRKNELSAF